MELPGNDKILDVSQKCCRTKVQEIDRKSSPNIPLKGSWIVLVLFTGKPHESKGNPMGEFEENSDCDRKLPAHDQMCFGKRLEKTKDESNGNLMET